MNENKVPCGGFEVDPTYFYMYEGQLGLNTSFIDGFNFMKGYYANLTQEVDESSGTSRWRMKLSDIQGVIFNIENGNPVFVEIMAYRNPGEYTYSTGSLCCYKEGKKLIFSCPQSDGTTFSVNFYDVNINTGIATMTTKQLS